MNTYLQHQWYAKVHDVRELRITSDFILNDGLSKLQTFPVPSGKD